MFNWLKRLFKRTKNYPLCKDCKFCDQSNSNPEYWKCNAPQNRRERVIVGFVVTGQAIKKVEPYHAFCCHQRVLSRRLMFSGVWEHWCGLEGAFFEPKTENQPSTFVEEKQP
jgi:hypothetical protein